MAKGPIVERTLVQRSTNDQKDRQPKTKFINCKLILLQSNNPELQTYDKVHVHTVRCFSVSIVYRIAKLNGIGFINAQNTIL